MLLSTEMNSRNNPNRIMLWIRKYLHKLHESVMGNVGRATITCMACTEYKRDSMKEREKKQYGSTETFRC